MKLTTIVRGGQDRAAVVLDLPEGWEGSAPPGQSVPAAALSSSSGPAPGHVRYYLDVGAAIVALEAERQRLPWTAATWGARYYWLDVAGNVAGRELITVRKLIAGGPVALAAVRDLCEIVHLLALAGDGAVVAPALVPAGQARLRTPVPDPPLYLVLHGNCPIVWRKQVTGDTARHITRTLVPRVRTVNSLLGHEEPLYLPAGARLTFGIEFAFVIGATARNVSAENAYAHVAGYVCTNDCYSNVYSDLVRSRSGGCALRNSAMQIGDKATDGCGPVGPWIATPDEVGDPHDLLLWVRQDGELRNRAYTGSYLIGVEEVLERLSRLFTLQPGTIVSLGSAGWDGVWDKPRDRESGSTILEVEAERVGVLRTPVYHPDAVAQAARGGRSPFFFVGTIEGSSPLERLQTDRAAVGDIGPPALAGLPAPHGFWMLLGNQRDAATLEMERLASPDLPVPVAYPAASLALSIGDAGPTAVERLVELSASTGTIRVTCQLAFVVGPEAAYAETVESAVQHVAGFGTLLSIHDAGPLERLEPPTTDYEQRFATFLGYSEDGHHLLGQVVPVASPAELPVGRPARLRVGECEYAACTDDYAHGAVATLCHLSLSVTLLPGDVIALGPLGPAVALSTDDLRAGISVEAHVIGSVPVRARIYRIREGHEGSLPRKGV